MTREFQVGVLLAGGASSRMKGRPKALLRDESGRTFIERLVEALRRGGCRAVIVVGGRHVAEIAQELPEDALLVRNPRWESGQLSSAQAGLRAALAIAASRVVLHLVDQPLIRPADVAKVLGSLGGADLAIAAHRGEPGHPIALSAQTAERVARSRASNLRVALEQAAPQTVIVEGCSAGCVRGANTPAELRALLGRRK
ncbi:MAG TPA: NTP transferase domain-containing protein [Myxococcales bacterium]|jgi:CTP:molybdopterin cytidylyltransferase MocA